jgi:hypothetical protein
VHDRHRLAFVVDRVLDGHPDEPFGAEFGDRLNADARIWPDPLPHLARQEFDDALGLRCAARPLDAGVDVFGVLAEDDDVHQFGALDRRRRSLEVAHRAHARVQIEHLPKRHVQAADAAAYRRGQRALDCNFVSADSLERIVGQPLAVLVLGLLARGHFEPRDLFLAAERLGDGGVEHTHARAPDVRAGAITFYIRDDRIVGYDEPSGFPGNGSSCRRRFQNRKIRH